MSGEFMKRLRVLLLGPDCHPTERASLLLPILMRQRSPKSMMSPWSLDRPLRTICGAQTRRFGLEVVRMPIIERIHAWALRMFVRAKLWLSREDRFRLADLMSPLNGEPGDSCGAGSWPANSMSFSGSYRCQRSFPSPFAYFLRKGPIPFVIGPIQAALPFPKSFTQPDNQKQWIASLKEFVPISAFCPVHLSPRGSDHSWFVPGVCRICCVWRQNVFCPRARHRPLQCSGRLPSIRTLAPNLS